MSNLVQSIMTTGYDHHSILVSVVVVDADVLVVCCCCCFWCFAGAGLLEAL